MSLLPQSVIGVEQIREEQINHTKTDWRPVFSFAVFTVFTIAALIVSEVTK